jgi:hypothetical protein
MPLRPASRSRFLFFLAGLVLSLSAAAGAAQETKPKFRIIALAEHASIHRPFADGAIIKDYVAKFATATVVVEDQSHPPMKNLGGSFVIKDEEWYTYDKSPRPNVHVLGHVDESSYSPDTKIKMGGDHPVVWTNENVKARNIYIFMGHRPEHSQKPAFNALFTNSIFWAARQRNSSGGCCFPCSPCLRFASHPMPLASKRVLRPWRFTRHRSKATTFFSPTAR